MKIIERINNEYLQQNIDNPKYIFHGSKELVSILNTNTAHDLNNNPDNMQKAVYGSSVFKGAVPYAIKGKGRYDCSIGYKPDNLIMKITYGIIPEDEFGYIYVCDTANFHQFKNTCQFVSYEPIIPIEIIKIYYRDFKECFEYVSIDKSKKNNKYE